MSITAEVPLFVSVPHSGEQVPAEVTWLSGLPETTLMRDVDRYVDSLYKTAIDDLNLTHVQTPWHRYVIDLNRLESDYDQSAVSGAKNSVGSHPKGLHWSVTTHSEVLIVEPMSQTLHDTLVEKYYRPFHDSVNDLHTKMKQTFGESFHLDLHSMPSMGTEFHPDPGQSRSEIVVSDYHGRSANPEFRDIVMQAYQKAGFQVAYNWPYVGGGITKRYGRPQEKFHTIQVEINRALYMNEETKQINSSDSAVVGAKLKEALEKVVAEIGGLLRA